MSERWSRWFVLSSLVHGAGVAAWSGLFLLDGVGVTLNLARVIAGGGAGTWFTVGYLLYLVAGFLGMGAQGFLYFYAARDKGGEVYSDRLAAAHLVLMNVAVVGATWMLGYAGFIGGTLTLAARTAEVHGAIEGFVNPIGYFVVVGVVAAVIGAYNLAMTLRR